MPFPTVEVGDPISFYDGTTSRAGQANSTGPTIQAWIQPAGAKPGFYLVDVPYDATVATADTWSWPPGSGSSPVPAFNSQSGTSYASTANDRVIGMSDDAARTITPTITPSGTTLLVVDTSGSVTAGHTITFSGGATIHGVATITPGTNKAVEMVSDGTAFWVVFKQ
jgi:hypothetical protein